MTLRRPARPKGRAVDPGDPIQPLCEAVLQGVEEPLRRKARASARLTFRQWAEGVPEPKTGPINFERFPYQREWYEKGAEIAEIDLMKSTQVGASAWLVRWTLYWADLDGLTMLYVFPADAQLKDFYNQRIATLFRGSYLSSRVEHAAVLNIRQQNLGAGPKGVPTGGWVNLRGAQTTAGLESVDADGVAMDEYDLIPKEAIPVAERRLSGLTSRGLMRRIGWPSVEDFGIAKLYDESDRRRWFVKCPKCREQQFLRFFQRQAREHDEGGDGLPNATSGYVDLEDATLKCGKCHKRLTQETIAKGEWVAEFPSRDNRGYHAHRLIVPGARLEPLVKASRQTDPWQVQSFYNRDLGEPYSPKEGRLSRAAIAAAQSAGGGYEQSRWDVGYLGAALVTMGVDSASERDLNVRISAYEGPEDTQKRALFIGQVADWNQLAQMMDLYNVRMACIDHLPDGRLARAFTQRFYGRAYYVHFLPSTSHERLTWDPEERKAAVKRTEAIDATLGLVRSNRNRLPADLPEGWVDQMRNVVRFHELDEMGRRTVGYKSIGAIDYLMCEVYDFLARQLVEVEIVAEAITADSFSTLDEHIEFERSSLHDDDPMPDYFPGPPEPD